MMIQCVCVWCDDYNAANEWFDIYDPSAALHHRFPSLSPSLFFKRIIILTSTTNCHTKEVDNNSTRDNNNGKYHVKIYIYNIKKITIKEEGIQR